MKVFATRFLEPMSSDLIPETAQWTWSPDCEDANRIFASGANTSTRTSTYADERDNRGDSDRPNEGLFVA